jgi:hypothetical protein
MDLEPRRDALDTLRNALDQGPAVGQRPVQVEDEVGEPQVAAAGDL